MFKLLYIYIYIYIYMHYSILYINGVMRIYEHKSMRQIYFHRRRKENRNVKMENIQHYQISHACRFALQATTLKSAENEH
jgi:hypothetical protein